jgi:hypothetical protein
VTQLKAAARHESTERKSRTPAIVMPVASVKARLGLRFYPRTGHRGFVPRGRGLTIADVGTKHGQTEYQWRSYASWCTLWFMSDAVTRAFALQERRVWVAGLPIHNFCLGNRFVNTATLTHF